MNRIRLVAVSLFAVSVLLVAVAGTSYAAPRHFMGKDTLVVKITKTGSTVWGRVSGTYRAGGKTHMLGTCKTSKCTWHTPHMVAITLSEKAVNSSTWPFHGWSMDNGGKMSTKMKTKITIQISGGMATATANYVFK
ncbi:MAG TPA: hypothetical protein VG815_17920 [Chloroflexota bacterium]|jgi:hypothetical protein|nr:hypothetical protein [Chloroflexota bacterium]